MKAPVWYYSYITTLLKRAGAFFRSIVVKYKNSFNAIKSLISVNLRMPIYEPAGRRFC